LREKTRAKARFLNKEELRVKWKEAKPPCENLTLTYGIDFVVSQENHTPGWKKPAQYFQNTARGQEANPLRSSQTRTKKECEQNTQRRKE
jgi:hypothetical protein